MHAGIMQLVDHIRRSFKGSVVNKQWYLDRLSDSGSIVIALGMIALLLILLLVLRFRKARYPYERRGPLFSPAELHFFMTLERVVDNRARIYAKVRLADLVAVREGTSRRRFWQAFNAVACKHVDYVLCDREAHQVLCVIELDDRSHEHGDRKARDDFVDAVMHSAGIPIFHFPARTWYKAAEVRERLREVLG